MFRMARAEQRLRRAKLGPPLSLEDAALAALSIVDKVDLPMVEAFVRDAAGQKGVDLLRATRG
jgi:hypothetical protein